MLLLPSFGCLPLRFTKESWLFPSAGPAGILVLLFVGKREWEGVGGSGREWENRACTQITGSGGGGPYTHRPAAAAVRRDRPYP